MKHTLLWMGLLLLFVLSACKQEVPDSPQYTGQPLTIGVVGKAPDVREQQVTFRQMSLTELLQVNASSNYDAVFIMKEHLVEAAEAQYAPVYKQAGIPFFFIESKKAHIPFIDEETDYDEFPDTKSGDYMYGFYQAGGRGTYYGYGLYNNTVNEANVLDAFSRVFRTIETIKNTSHPEK